MNYGIWTNDSFLFLYHSVSLSHYYRISLGGVRRIYLVSSVELTQVDKYYRIKIGHDNLKSPRRKPLLLANVKVVVRFSSMFYVDYINKKIIMKIQFPESVFLRVFYCLRKEYKNFLKANFKDGPHKD